jgi:hypothetical protein
MTSTQRLFSRVSLERVEYEVERILGRRVRNPTLVLDQVGQQPDYDLSRFANAMDIVAKYDHVYLTDSN